MEQAIVCGLLPRVGLLPDAGGDLDRLRIALRRDQTFVHAETQHEFNHLKSFKQHRDMWRLVGCHIGAKHQNRDLDAVLANLVSHAALEVAWHVLDKIRDHIEQPVGGLIDRELGMQSHDGLNDQITEGMNLRTARARNS